jgi:proline iminopeptidase
VEVNGVRLFTRTVGRGPDVVVLHGGPGAHHDYLLPQYDDLASGCRLRYYDQRGGGQSQVTRDVDLGWQAHVADLVALLDHWKIDRAMVVGYSWGALLAMLFATEHPDRMTRMALVSGAAPTFDGRAEFERRFAELSQRPEIVAARAALQESGLRESDPEAYRQRAFELSVAGYFHDFGNVANMTPFRVMGRTQSAVWESLGRYDLRDGLAKLDIPALVMHGVHDPVPIESAKETANLLGAEFVEFTESGHVPHVEERDKFVTTLGRFLPSTG